MSRRAVALLVAVVLSCAPPVTIVSPSPSPSESAAATTSPTPSPGTTPTASPSATPGGRVVVKAVSAIPADHTYVLTGNTGAERVLLIDLPAKRSTEVVRFERDVGGSRSVSLTESADGKTLAILERSDTTVLLHVVRPVVGELRTIGLPQGVDTVLISPDGSRVAIARTSSDLALNGVWLVPADVDGSPQVRLVVERPDWVGTPPKPRAWSSDGRWLAVYATVGTGVTEIAAIDTQGGTTTFDPTTDRFAGGEVRQVGPGVDAEWSAGELLYWQSRTSAGGRALVSLYSLATRSSTLLYEAPADQNVADAARRPGTHDIVVATVPLAASGLPPRTLIFLEGGGAPRAMRALSFLIRMWWSPDGLRLYARTGGDDSTGTITDVYGTWGTMSFCHRGDGPPCP
ncbi:MAG TPA: hypothetical protein VGQ86_07110 [Candidatus Limnocylindria bacterium]|nr:hypothetical protein [Candidatus Limnocylindria bacterium]